MIRSDYAIVLMQAINSHFKLHISERLGIYLIFQNQVTPNMAALSKWVSLHVNGPLFETEVRSLNATLQVQLHLAIKEPENIYIIDELAGAIAQIASMPITVGTFDKCLQNLGVSIQPKGTVFQEQKLVASVIAATYSITLEN